MHRSLSSIEAEQCKTYTGIKPRPFWIVLHQFSLSGSLRVFSIYKQRFIESIIWYQCDWSAWIRLLGRSPHRLVGHLHCLSSEITRSLHFRDRLVACARLSTFLALNWRHKESPFDLRYTFKRFPRNWLEDCLDHQRAWWSLWVHHGLSYGDWSEVQQLCILESGLRISGYGIREVERVWARWHWTRSK